MGVIFNANWRYWNAKAQSDQVGWTLPTADQPLWPYQRLAKMVPALKQAGFTTVLLPPSCECAAGIYSGGYDLFNNYSLENTAFGSGEMLRQLVATVHANGMHVYGDMVLHQYDGGPGDTYVYPGSDPKIKNGRFPKTPSCFAGPPPGVLADPVPDTEGNFAFGALAAYKDSVPAGYMHDGAVAAGEWLTQTVDFDGYRIDDTKGTYAPVIWDLLHSPSIKDLYAFGEYFTGENNALWNWVHGYMQGRAGTLDFGFHFNVGNICNNNSRSWMGSLSQIGYCNVDPTKAVTFVESADTDNSPGEQIIWNKMLGYALMLTYPGYPVVYARDYFDGPNCYGLKAPIDNLVWIHENLANGDFVPRMDWHPQVFVHERLGLDGAPGCLCGFNNDQYHYYTVTVQTSHPPNTRLHEYTGKYDTDLWTDAQGKATFTLPPNVNGMAYLVFGLWIEPQPLVASPQATTQTFFGALDLVTPPARNGKQAVGRISVAAGADLGASITLDKTGWTGNSLVEWQVIGPDGVSAAAGAETLGASKVTANNKASASGWHSILLSSTGLPSAGSQYDFEITYTAPQNAIL